LHAIETNKPTKRRRAWKTLAFVFSPLGLAFLWCAFVDQEAFGAFVLGVLFTGLFGVFALGRLLNKRSDEKKASEIHDA
jgi:TctA family transporter